jgi:dTMP kinase
MLQCPQVGTFIVLEGLDGSGSSTQITLLASWLEQEGYKVLLVKQPSANIIGGLIRGQLTHDWKTSPECLQLLFAADRAHQVEKDIIPALAQGGVVIADRHFYTSVAYGQAHGLSEQWLFDINSQVPAADLVVLLKVAPEICLERIRQTRFSIELFENVENLRKCWEGYERLAQKLPYVKMINGEQSKEVVHEQIKCLVEPYLTAAVKKLPL